MNLFNKEENLLMGNEVNCDTVCPTCGHACTLHEKGNENQAEFVNSLAPTGCKFHRCHKYHQWLDGKYGIIALHESATNKNMLDELQQVVKDNEPPHQPISNVAAQPIITSSVIISDYNYTNFISNWYGSSSPVQAVDLEAVKRKNEEEERKRREAEIKIDTTFNNERSITLDE